LFNKKNYTDCLFQQTDFSQITVSVSNPEFQSTYRYWICGGLADG